MEENFAYVCAHLHETSFTRHVINTFTVRISPIYVVELLFFAIFGQTTHEQFKEELNQPEWTKVLFKLAFGIYMLVSVVVLINLLIAMMSDTYQRIQAQSDIEWKYGLSKLVRNMVRTTTAPSPLNLMSTWITYLCKLCKKRFSKKSQRPSLLHLMTGTRMSPRSRMGAKWLSKVKGRQIGHKDSVNLSVTRLSPLGSQLSFGNTVKIDNVVDWDVVRRKYRDLYGEEVEEKSVEENKESTETNPLAALEGSNDNDKSKLLVKVSAIDITENLFFAIFGKKDTDDFAITYRNNQQPKWTVYFFKVSFSLYMLVSVIVLINLLIAMMSDTYHKVISQSDIEWKYGLSKLVRKMQKTRTAPAPLNLITTWAEYLKSVYMRRRIAKEKIGRSRGYMEPDMHQSYFPKYPLSANNRIPLPRTKDSVNFALLQSSPANSQSSLSHTSRIDNVVDWDTVRRKYRMQFCSEMEKPSDGVARLAGMA